MELRARFRWRGFWLGARGDQLIVGPASWLTDADRAALATHKGALLALLATEPIARS